MKRGRECMRMYEGFCGRNKESGEHMDRGIERAERR